MQQVIVFDVGSTATRVHVFNFSALPAEDPSRAHVPRIDVPGRETLIKPGLGEYARTGDLAGAERVIEELIDFARKFVPTERWETTPALLKATAGLRALPEWQAEALLERANRTLARSRCQFRPGWGHIIEGKEEGGLAWVAANYLNGTLDQAQSWHTPKPTIGVIELGGESLQVTFQVGDNERRPDSSDAFVFQSALGNTYYVYAHSYLGFGQARAQQRLIEKMNPTETEDPCYARGYVREVGGAPVKGIGNWSRCQANINQTLLQNSSESPGLYAHEMPPSGSFAATVNFYYVQHRVAESLLGLKLEDAVVSVADLEKEAEAICSLNASREAKTSSTAEMSLEEVTMNACFALSYQALLLQTLQVPSVRITNKINHGVVDWALGAALVHLWKARPNGERMPSKELVSVAGL